MELKSSAYNLFASADEPGYDIVYNTRSGALGLVNDRGASLLKNGTAFDPEECIEFTEESLDSMVEVGILIDEDRNEFIEVEADHCLMQQDPSVLSLCIAPTYSCNLMCPYCYEAGRNASGQMMDATVQDKIISFARMAFEAKPYERIEVQWYGGEPLLAPEAIEHISQGLMDLCKARGLGYSANMVSNATRIGAEEAAMLKRCCVNDVLVTIDGPEEMHNQRRPTRDGSNSYQAVLSGVGNLIRESIHVKVLVNTDRVNDPKLDELNKELGERFGLVADRTKLNDYYGTFGRGRFCEPGFSLMDHREFSRLQCSRFCEGGRTPQEFSMLLQPIQLFCKGQMERYYCIDALGDVYKCDGRMGRTDYVLFNLDEIRVPADIPTETAPAYPFDENSCVACALLPLCKGTCEWERKQCEDRPCHPLKYTTPEYLQGWVRSFGPFELFRPDVGFSTGIEKDFLLLSGRRG